MPKELSDPNTLVAIATFVLALAAIAQFELTRRTAKRQLRAYVAMESASLVDGTKIDPPPHIDRTDQPGVVITVRNSGQTPARDVLHWAQLDVATVDREWAMNPPSALARISPSMISPQGTLTKGLWLDRQLSSTEKEGIRDGSRGIYLYGRIEYVDAFKRKRWATYRLRYSSSAWPPYGNNASMTFCNEGNDSN